MDQLCRQSQGSWHKDGTERFIEDFLKPDVAISPKYRYDVNQAEQLMGVRQDSRGSPVRRTFLGSLQNYREAEVMAEKKKQCYAKTKTKRHKSGAYQNVNLLPQIGGHRPSNIDSANHSRQYERMRSE